MEVDRKDQEKKRTAPGTGEQYLIALIKCADWVSIPYKHLADKNRAATEVLKELYLCACDGIPVEKAVEALEKSPPEGALRFIRQKHLEKIAIGDYEKDLSGLKKTTSALEQEVKLMSETLTHIANHVPNFDVMFPEKEPAADKAENGVLQEPIVQSQDDMHSEKATSSETNKTAAALQNNLEFSQENQLKESFWKTGIQKIRKMSSKKKTISEFMELCLEEGYSQEQLNYFLDCIEKGISLEEIKRIASPKLPVDMMKRLRMMEERKEMNYGKR